MDFIDFNHSAFRSLSDGAYHQFSNISSYATYNGSNIKLETDFGDFVIEHIHSDHEEIDKIKIYKCDRIRKIS